MVLPVAAYKLSADQTAIEGAFLEHLRILKRGLPDNISMLSIMGPTMSDEKYQQRSGYLAIFSRELDGIEFLPLENEGTGRLEYFLKHFLRCSLKIWTASRDAHTVHAGPSLAYRPSEFVAIVAAILRRVPTVFIVDVDWRERANMNRATGRWTRRSYLLSKYLYDPLFSLQVRIACRFCSLVLLKGQGLVETYGQGRKNVKNLLDAAHSKDHVIPRALLDKKLGRLRNRNNPILLTYFGRLTAYKGVDFCLTVLHELKNRAPGRFRMKIIGTGEEMEALKNQTNQLGLTQEVDFIGALPFGPQLFSEIQSCDVAMATPLSPDAPRSALDAMCSGLPLVAFDIEYYRSLEHMSNAVRTARWNDIESTVNVLLELDAQREQLATMAANAVTFALENTQEIWLQRRAQWMNDHCWENS